MILSEAHEQFMHVKTSNGLTDKSLKSYNDYIRRFINVVGDIDIHALNNDVMLVYADSLNKLERAKKLARATVATYMRNAKIFATWIYDEYSIDINTKKIKVPKTHNKNPHIYSDDEIRMIYQTILKSRSWLDFRNCAVVSLMLDSGLRQNEVCTLQWSKTDLVKGIANVLGKGNKERLVPLGNTTIKLIRTYTEMCPYSSESVFMNKSGKPMTTNCVKLFVSKLSKKLPFEFSSHKLRHNFATNFLLDQYEKYGHMDIFALSMVLGHSDVETTKKYLHYAQEIIFAREHNSHVDGIIDDLF